MKKIEINVKNNDELIIPFVWINDEENEFSYKITITGDNASVILLGIFLGTGHHAVTFNTDVTHIGKNTKSLTTIRAVFLNNAAFSNDGMVRIHNGAKNTNGYFDSKVLLFDDAKGRSVPSLEIDENEVKAGHGSTIGRPDENQLFYMRSRGLTEKEAEQLIIGGFFDPIITKLSLDQQKVVQKKIDKAVQNIIV